MAKKPQTPALGYVDQPPAYDLGAGHEVSAGDATAAAAASWCDRTCMTLENWNALQDDERQAFILEWVDEEKSAIAEELAKLDQPSPMDAVAASAERDLGAKLIEAALEQIRVLPRPWQAMPEKEQQDVLDRLASRVQDAVRDAILALATRGHRYIRCKLEQIAIKDKAKAQLILPNSVVDEDMVEAVGSSVILIVATNFDEADKIVAPRAEPDQADLLDQVARGMGGDDDDAGDMAQHSDPED